MKLGKVTPTFSTKARNKVIALGGIVVTTTLSLSIASANAQTWSQYGNTIYGPSGSYSTYGNTTYGPSGSYSTYGNTTYGPSGSYSTYGNTTYGPGGSISCYGNTCYGPN